MKLICFCIAIAATAVIASNAFAQQPQPIGSKLMEQLELETGAKWNLLGTADHLGGVIVYARFVSATNNSGFRSFYCLPLRDEVWKWVCSSDGFGQIKGIKFIH